jgi:hypothetical protein
MILLLMLPWYKTFITPTLQKGSPDCRCFDTKKNGTHKLIHHGTNLKRRKKSMQKLG